MKKIKIFLIIIICILLKLNINVYAEQTTFYEGEYIPGIWMNKVKNNTIYYQTARFFRQSGTNNFAYCIEPFEMFIEFALSLEQHLNHPCQRVAHLADRLELPFGVQVHRVADGLVGIGILQTVQLLLSHRHRMANGVFASHRPSAFPVGAKVDVFIPQRFIGLGHQSFLGNIIGNFTTARAVFIDDGQHTGVSFTARCQ